MPPPDGNISRKEHWLRKKMICRWPLAVKSESCKDHIYRILQILKPLLLQYTKNLYILQGFLIKTIFYFQNRNVEVNGM